MIGSRQKESCWRGIGHAEGLAQQRVSPRRSRVDGVNPYFETPFGGQASKPLPSEQVLPSDCDLQLYVIGFMRRIVLNLGS